MNQRHELIATKIAIGRFMYFCNPEKRGPDFKWRTCPQYIADWVDSTFFIYFPYKPKYDSAELMTYVEEMVMEWIERAGFKDDE